MSSLFTFRTSPKEAAMLRFVFMTLLLQCTCTLFAQNLSLIPQPVSVVQRAGTFTLDAQTPLVVADAADSSAAAFFNQYLQQFYGFSLPLRRGGTRGIRLVTRRFIQAPAKDAYQLQTDASGALITGDTHAGTFQGVTTLLQLLPVDQNASQGRSLPVPFVQITDAPRFAYRGMHLDVSRHLFPVAFIKQYIDYLALHKMNFFHWHLTDDQGWRIEIKKYPLLTQIGAWRDGTLIGRYPGKGSDQTPYGGFYTQEAIKELVQYAADRHITVVPEIEMPGHALAALSAYPYLGCPGTGPYQVAQTWGVFTDVFCAGSDSTFAFLQDVLDEVIALFPSPYLHVGGDECPKDNWRQCPRCQERIGKEGLGDEHGLQSYFIQRIERYLHAKGKTIIGWDEILEGGLAPNAIVMSWRGEKGGIEAARQKHQVIMTPGSHVYLDHSQSEQEDSVTFGGYTPLEKVYAYEPIPKALTPAQAPYIMGAQANVWTEYIRYPSKVAYQVFPRMSALSEVLWSPRVARNWKSFEQRMTAQYKRYELWGAPYSNAVFELRTTLKPAPANKGLLVAMTTKDKNATIQYRTEGLPAARNYTGPVWVQQDAVITGMVNRKGNIIDSTTVRLRFNLATGKKIRLSELPASNYPGSGAFTLVDGVINSQGLNRTSEFIGYNGKILTLTVDLGAAQPVSEVRLHALFASNNWIYPPQLLTVRVSADGKNYQPMGSARELMAKDPVKGYLGVVAEKPLLARYVQLKAEAVQQISAHMPGAGQKGWMFLDEIEIW